MKKIFLILTVLLAGCNLKTDKLYIFQLNQPPVEADWKNGLPYFVPVEKGKLNQAPAETNKLDRETIHSSNKTCHHTNYTNPVSAELTGFYTSENLYLRIKWPDKSKDDTPAFFDTLKNAWNKIRGSEDGLGIFVNPGNSLNCSAACHISDWEVNNAFMSPVCQMKTRNNEKYNLLVWYAGRNKSDNSAWNILVDSSGIHEPSPSPAYNPEDLNVDKIDKIKTESYYEDGYWTVTIIYPLTNSKFFEILSSSPDSFKFQLALFDNTYSDHSISSKIQEAVFVKQTIQKTKVEKLPLSPPL